MDGDLGCTSMFNAALFIRAKIYTTEYIMKGFPPSELIIISHIYLFFFLEGHENIYVLLTEEISIIQYSVFNYSHHDYIRI